MDYNNETLDIVIKQIYVMHVRSVIKNLAAENTYKLLYNIDQTCKNIADLEEEIDFTVTVRDVKFLLDQLCTKPERTFTKINFELKNALTTSIMNLASDPTKLPLVQHLSTYMEEFNNSTDQMILLGAQYEKSLIT